MPARLQLIPRIGNFITGSFVPDEEDIVSAVPKKGADGLTYYVYEVGSERERESARTRAVWWRRGRGYLAASPSPRSPI